MNICLWWLNEFSRAVTFFCCVLQCAISTWVSETLNFREYTRVVSRGRAQSVINQAQFSLWSFELTPCMILYLKNFKKHIKWTVSSFSSSFGALNYCNRIWLKAMSATATEWTVKLFSQLQFPKWTFQLRLIRQEWRKRRKTSVISWQKGKFHLLRKVM